MFEQLLKKNASIIEAYQKMKEGSCDSPKQELDEDDDGGDASAYNKYLLAKTGDLPKSKEDYMKTEEILPNKFHADHDHQIKKVTGHKSEFKQQEHLPKEKVDDKKKMSDLKESDDDLDARYNKWRDDVQAAHPGKKMTFKYRDERKSVKPTVMTSAEEPHKKDARVYGVWDHDKDEGHVFHINEEKMTDAQMKRREEIVMTMKDKMPDFEKRYGDRAKDVMYATATKKALEEGTIGELLSPAVFKHGSRTFNTYSFPTHSAANNFMVTPQGQQYGYIGMDDQGQYHVAHMDDQGALDK